MRIEGILRSVLAASGSLLASISSTQLQAQHPPPVLIGQITSDQEGAMEGVVVSARKDGSTITIRSSATGKATTLFQPPSWLPVITG
jgi:hypothetical protein